MRTEHRAGLIIVIRREGWSVEAEGKGGGYVSLMSPEYLWRRKPKLYS